MPALVKPPSISWAEVLKRTWKEADHDDVWGRSAQLSYYFFLSLFPLLICMIALLSVFSAAGVHLRQEVMLFFARVLPVSTSELIQRTLAEVNESHSGSKLSLGLLFSVWTATAGMSAVMDTLNAAYEVRETRSFVKRNGIAIGLTLVTAALMLAAAAIVVTGVPASELRQDRLTPILLKVVEWPVAILLVLVGFALIYFLAPDVKQQKWHWVTPGAVAGLTLWLFASIALRVYLHFFDSYSATYGSLGAVIILMLWFYLTGISVLIGAEINSVIEDAAAQEGTPDAKRKGETAPGEPRPARG